MSLDFAVALVVGGMAGMASTAAAAMAIHSAEPERETEYLRRGLAQLQRLEKGVGSLTIERYGAGALAAAALAAAGADTAAEASRFSRTLLAACSGKWHRVSCERAQISMQRLLLQYPDVLDDELRQDLRRQAARGAPPPDPALVSRPWTFTETENQRWVRTARCLVAHTVMGTGDSPAARAWAQYTRAILDAHGRDGWYEGESPGYLGISVTALLLLADHAPDAATGVPVRDLAARQLDVVLASWAQLQVGGYPAGAKSRTYVHWALGSRMVPWPAWAWLLAGIGDPGRLNFGDSPDLAVSRYRPPRPVRVTLATRQRLGEYEVLQRRRIRPSERRDLDAALYSYATPDYILSAAQAVHGHGLGVSGGQEIMATLYAEGGEFAPVYLWSRIEAGPRQWGSAVDRDRAVGWRNVVLAKLGDGGRAVGYAYLAPSWAPPVIEGDAVISEYGGTRIALLTVGAWQLAPAAKRFTDLYGGDKHYRDSWVAVPKQQPAIVALLVGRRRSYPEAVDWHRRVAGYRLAAQGEVLILRDGDEELLRFEPGRAASAAGAPLPIPRPGELLSGPLIGGADGVWKLGTGERRQTLLQVRE